MERGGIEMMPFKRCSVILMLVLLGACDSSVNSVERTQVELGSAEGCDASVRSCQLARDGVEMRLALEKNIRTMQPFQLQLHLAGIQQPVEAVNVEFFMEGMDMGVNRYRLLHHENGWKGEITLPICVAGTGDWRAEVEVKTQERRYHGIFRFHSSG